MSAPYAILHEEKHPKGGWYSIIQTRSGITFGWRQDRRKKWVERDWAAPCCVNQTEAREIFPDMREDYFPHLDITSKIDAQKSRVYRWEGIACSGYTTLMDTSSHRRYMEHIFSLFPSIPSPKLIYKTNSKHRSGACGWGSIRFRGNVDELYALHEYAHWMIRQIHGILEIRDVAHGSEFAGVVMVLYEKILRVPRARLVESAHQNKVSFLTEFDPRIQAVLEPL